MEFKAPRLRLSKAMHESQLIVPFLIMISQLLLKIIYDGESTHLKILSKEVDRCQLILRLLIEFLHMNIPTKNLTEILPSIRTFLMGTLI